MTRSSLLLAFVLGTMTLTASGCAVEVAPPPRYEVATASPGAGFVWERGHYFRRGREWIWVGGRWRRTA